EVADHSRSYQLARQLAELAFIGEAHADGDSAVLHEPRDAAWQEAWRVTEAVLAKMSAFSRRNGAQLAVVGIPHPRQARQAMGYPEQRLGAFAKQSGIAFIGLGEALKPEMYLPSGRWSAEAHRVAAEMVARRLCTATARPG